MGAHDSLSRYSCVAAGAAPVREFVHVDHAVRSRCVHERTVHARQLEYGTRPCDPLQGWQPAVTGRQEEERDLSTPASWPTVRTPGGEELPHVLCVGGGGLVCAEPRRVPEPSDLALDVKAVGTVTRSRCEASSVR